jgi:primary-amine oxidase
MRALAPLLLVVALVLPGSAGAQAPQHPLDGLSLAEHWVVYDVIRDSGRIDGNTRYAGVALREPPKAEVLAWKAGAAFRREARAILMLGPKTVEATVDIAGRKLLSWKEVPGVQADVTGEEFQAQDEIAKKSPEVIAALKRRGITDLTTVSCDGGSTPGYYGIQADEGRRLVVTTCVDEHGVENTWGREIEGLVIYIDLHEKKVLRVVDTGVVPVARGAVDYHAEAIGRGRDPLPPLRVEQPMGPGFKRDGNEVSWDGWRFHVRVEGRSGAVISNVRYQDGARSRSVLYQGALSEIFVPYMDPADGWYQRTFFDGGEFGHSLGLARRPLERGTDCPDHAAWFDMVLANERGLPRRHPAVACLFERAAGDVAWRHRAGDSIVDSRPRRDLVLRWIATLGNYDYVFDWVFEPNGSIRGVIGATGIAEVKGVASRTAAEDTDGKDGAYGRFVAENIVAPNHDHFFSYRLDLDVDGTDNSLEVDQLEAKRLPESHPRKSLWVVVPRTAKTESEAELDRHVPALWRFVNPAVKGPLGYPTSYQIKAGHGDEPMLAKDDYPQRRAGFTEHALWVTPYRPDEQYAAGDYPTLSRGGDGLPAWTRANRPIEKTDIVAWYTFGMHHVVRAEDWPVMPTVYHEFELRPFDFFSRNPALDLPKP